MAEALADAIDSICRQLYEQMPPDEVGACAVDALTRDDFLVGVRWVLRNSPVDKGQVTRILYLPPLHADVPPPLLYKALLAFRRSPVKRKTALAVHLTALTGSWMVDWFERWLDEELPEPFQGSMPASLVRVSVAGWYASSPVYAGAALQVLLESALALTEWPSAADARTTIEAARKVLRDVRAPAESAVTSEPGSPSQPDRIEVLTSTFREASAAAVRAADDLATGRRPSGTDRALIDQAITAFDELSSDVGLPDPPPSIAEISRMIRDDIAKASLGQRTEHLLHLASLVGPPDRVEMLNEVAHLVF
jgi:hypothetical protein